MQTRFVSSIILSAILNIHTTTDTKTLDPTTDLTRHMLHSPPASFKL